MATREEVRRRAEAIGFVLCRVNRYGVPPYNWPHRWYLCPKGKHNHAGPGMLTLDMVEEKIALLEGYRRRSPSWNRVALLKRVREILRKGRKFRVLTYDELADLLPDSEIGPDEIDEILQILDDARIYLLDTDELEAAKQAVQSQSPATEVAPPEDSSGPEQPRPRPRPAARQPQRGERPGAASARTVAVGSTAPPPSTKTRSGRPVRSPRPQARRARKSATSAVLMVRTCMLIATAVLMDYGCSPARDAWQTALLCAVSGALFFFALALPSRIVAGRKEADRTGQPPHLRRPKPSRSERVRPWAPSRS